MMVVSKKLCWYHFLGNISLYVGLLTNEVLLVCTYLSSDIYFVNLNTIGDTNVFTYFQQPPIVEYTTIVLRPNLT